MALSKTKQRALNHKKRMESAGSTSKAKSVVKKVRIPKEQRNKAWRESYATMLKQNVASTEPKELSTVCGATPKHSVMDGSWKRLYDDPDMQDREQRAQEIIRNRNKQVAPAYNKGAYQLVTDPNALKDLYRS